MTDTIQTNAEKEGIFLSIATIISSNKCACMSRKYIITTKMSSKLISNISIYLISRVLQLNSINNIKPPRQRPPPRRIRRRDQTDLIPRPVEAHGGQVDGIALGVRGDVVGQGLGEVGAIVDEVDVDVGGFDDGAQGPGDGVGLVEVEGVAFFGVGYC